MLTSLKNIQDNLEDQTNSNLSIGEIAPQTPALLPIKGKVPGNMSQRNSMHLKPRQP